MAVKLRCFGCTQKSNRYHHRNEPNRIKIPPTETGFNFHTYKENYHPFHEFKEL